MFLINNALIKAEKVEMEANILTLPTFIARSYVDIIQNLGYEILDAVVSPLALSSIFKRDKKAILSTVSISILIYIFLNT